MRGSPKAWHAAGLVNGSVVWFVLLGSLAVPTANSLGAEPFNPVATADLRGRVSRPSTLALPPGGKPAAGVRVYVTLPPYRTPETMRVVTRIETAGAAATADRTFTVTLTPRDHLLPGSGVVGQFDVTLRQDARSAEAITYVPKASYGTDYRIAIAEGGRAIDALEGTLQFNTRSLDWSNEAVADESTARVLVIADDWLPPGQAAMAQLIGQRRTYLSPGLANDWRAYSPFDFVVLTAARWTAADGPQSVALQRWVRCGGNVLLTDTKPADRRSEGQRSLVEPYETVTSWTEMDLEQISVNNPLLGSGLQSNQVVDLIDWLGELDRNQDLYSRDQIAVEGPLEPIARKLWRRIDVESARGDPTDADPMTLQAFGAGRLFRCATSLQQPAGLQIPLAVARNEDQWRSLRLLRRGADPVLGTQRFAAWLIPGLGQPPVYSFIALLTLFTLAVGPFAYYKTSRAGRAYLMFLIAPVLAILTTAAMISYGVVADGFDTHVRVRQITWLGDPNDSDGQASHAATRTRSTYFAGIRPDGLMFAPEADLTLLPDSDGRPWWERQDDRSGPERVFRIRGDSIVASENFLPSRQQRQFITTQPRDELGRLTLLTTSEGPVRLRHTLPTTLRELIVCDSDSQLHHAMDVLTDVEMQMDPMTSKESGERLGEMYTSEWLVSTRVNQNDRRRNIGGNQLSDLAASVSNQFVDATKPLEGLFEYELQLRMQLSSGLTPGTFIAVADLTDDALVIADANPTGSIHFIFGPVVEQTP